MLSALEDEENKGEFDLRYTMSGPVIPYNAKPRATQNQYKAAGNLLDSVNGYEPIPQSRTTKELLQLAPGAGGMKKS